MLRLNPPALLKTYTHNPPSPAHSQPASEAREHTPTPATQTAGGQFERCCCCLRDRGGTQARANRAASGLQQWRVSATSDDVTVLLPASLLQQPLIYHLGCFRTWMFFC